MAQAVEPFRSSHLVARAHICTGETYKDKVKMTFARGASLEDPSGLFNSSLDGGTRRAIDVHEGDTIALKALIGEAVAVNVSSQR